MFLMKIFVVNKEKNKMLAVYHKIADGWTYPGGHADGDDNLLEVAIREVYEETGIKLDINKIQLIDTLSGKSRKNSYPNGDIVYNNTSLFLATISLVDASNLKGDSETKRLHFFSLDSLPDNLMDKDLIQAYNEFCKK